MKPYYEDDAVTPHFGDCRKKKAARRESRYHIDGSQDAAGGQMCENRSGPAGALTPGIRPSASTTWMRGSAHRGL